MAPTNGNNANANERGDYVMIPGEWRGEGEVIGSSPDGRDNGVGPCRVNSPAGNTDSVAVTK